MEILRRCAALANVFITQDSITTSLTALSKCNGINLYVSRITKDCEYCLNHHYIVENKCVPFLKLAVGANMYKQCVAVHLKAGVGCEKCAHGKFSISTSDKTCITFYGA